MIEMNEAGKKHHITVFGSDLLAIETAKTAAESGFSVSLFRPFMIEEEKILFHGEHGKCIKKALEPLYEIEDLNFIDAESLKSIEGEPGNYILTFTGKDNEFKVNTEAIFIEPLMGQSNLRDFPEIACSENNKVLSSLDMDRIRSTIKEWDDQSSKTILFVTQGGSSRVEWPCNCYNDRAALKFSNEIQNIDRENKDIRIIILFNRSFDSFFLSKDNEIENQNFSIVEGGLAKILPEKQNLLALCFERSTNRPLRIKADLIVLDMVYRPTIENKLISETVDFTGLNSHNLNGQGGIYNLTSERNDDFKTYTLKEMAQDSLKSVNEFLMRKQE
jgi:hypothetical protein